jgi:hypothetical protein
MALATPSQTSGSTLAKSSLSLKPNSLGTRTRSGSSLICIGLYYGIFTSFRWLASKCFRTLGQGMKSIQKAQPPSWTFSGWTNGL